MIRDTLRGLAIAWSLRVYFALLFALVVGSSVAGALYVNREASRDARSDARHDALFSAKTAAEQLENHVAALKASAAGLAANPQIAQALVHPEGCTLAFQGLGGPDKGHIDIIGADGKVMCSSRPLKDDPKGCRLRELGLARRAPSPAQCSSRPFVTTSSARRWRSLRPRSRAARESSLPSPISWRSGQPSARFTAAVARTSSSSPPPTTARS